MNSTARQDSLVAAYLLRLERAAYALTPERRAELVLEIRDHIADARTVAGSVDEAWTRTLLDRLGAPEEIVAVAADDERAAPRPRREGFGPLEVIVMVTLVSALVLDVVGAVIKTSNSAAYRPDGINWVGLGALVAAMGVGLALASARWRPAAKWALAVVALAFTISWAVLVDFPPIATGDASGRTYLDPARWHWQGGFVALVVILAGTLVLLARDLKPRSGNRLAARELTALMVIAVGWWLGPLSIVIALAIAWRSPGLDRRGRWIAVMLCVPALVGWLAIPVGLAQRVNRFGSIDPTFAWVIALTSSALLFAWLVSRFVSTSTIQEQS